MITGENIDKKEEKQKILLFGDTEIEVETFFDFDILGDFEEMTKSYGGGGSRPMKGFKKKKQKPNNFNNFKKQKDNNMRYNFMPREKPFKHWVKSVRLQQRPKND